MKKFFAILLSLSMLICFAACSNDSGKEDKEDDSKEEITIDSETQEAGKTENGDATENASISDKDESSSDKDEGTSDKDEGTSDKDEGTSDKDEGTSETPSVSDGNEYDIIKSGRFYLKGTAVDASGLNSTMEIAISDDSVYMLGDMDGIVIGMIMNETEMIMISSEYKCYTSLSKEMMESYGMSEEEFSISEIGFLDMPSVSDAVKVTEEEYNGHNCTVYYFGVENGIEERLYMDGNKLICMADYSDDGKLVSAMNIEVVSAEIPDGKLTPPSDYESVNILEFISTLGMI